MDILCIDDKFLPEAILQIPNRPVKDRVYTIRDLFTISDGRIAVRLNELVNPMLEHPSGMGTFEPSFSIKRFTTLNGEPLTKEMVQEYITSPMVPQVPSKTLEEI